MSYLVNFIFGGVAAIFLMAAIACFVLGHIATGFIALIVSIAIFPR